jgi:hypothetical protein
MSHASRKKIRARIWLFIILLLLSGAHYFFYRFSINRLNTSSITPGLTFGCVLWTTVIWGAMWLRNGWARYVMIALICLGIFSYGWIAMVVREESIDPLPELTRMVVYGLMLYTAALVPLSASRTLRAYLAPRTAGER